MTESLLKMEENEDVLPPERWQVAWSREILRRLRQLKTGKAKLVDGDEVFRQVRKKLALSGWRR